MLETSIAYLLSMEIGRDLLEVPSNIFKIKGKTGPKSFQIQQCRWQGDRITFSPSKVVSDYAVFFIHGKDEGDNCITVPYQEVRAGIEAGEIETATIVKSSYTKFASMPKPIYYLTATVSYLKNKVRHKKQDWIVTTYETAREIMIHDVKTMQRLSDEIYGKSYKGERKIVIVKINERKEVGQTNW